MLVNFMDRFVILNIRAIFSLDDSETFHRAMWVIGCFIMPRSAVRALLGVVITVSSV